MEAEGSILIPARARVCEPDGVEDRSTVSKGKSGNSGGPPHSRKGMGYQAYKRQGRPDGVVGVGLAHSSDEAS